MKAFWVVIVLVGLLLWFWFHQKRNGHAGGNSGEKGMSVYLGLRNLALQNPPPAGVLSVIKPGKPFVVLMDWPVSSQATATVAAFADGTASIYLSNGGGFLGGGQAHESIRNSAVNTLEIADELKSFMHPTTTFPLPARGEVIFYVRTDSAVLTATAKEDDLRTHSNPLYRLGDSAQAIVTDYRLEQQEK